eukprot:3905485-Pyramimonas_sp.AAC.1
MNGWMVGWLDGWMVGWFDVAHKDANARRMRECVAEEIPTSSTALTRVRHRARELPMACREAEYTWIRDQWHVGRVHIPCSNAGRGRQLHPQRTLSLVNVRTNE